MGKTHSTEPDNKWERAILVGAGMDDYGEGEEIRSLDELEELAKTAGVVSVGRYYQRRGRPDTALYVGKGKVEEIRAGTREHEADLVIFDSDLSARQVRNLEKELDRRVVDRTGPT